MTRKDNNESLRINPQYKSIEAHQQCHQLRRRVRSVDNLSKDEYKQNGPCNQMGYDSHIRTPYTMQSRCYASLLIALIIYSMMENKGFGMPGVFSFSVVSKHPKTGEYYPSSIHDIYSKRSYSIINNEYFLKSREGQRFHLSPSPMTSQHSNSRILAQVAEDESGDTSDVDVSSDDEMEWRALFASLMMYKAAYSDLKVPHRFVVPDSAPWPKQAWGLKLGKAVYAIRSTGKYIDGLNQRREQLDKLGFAWSVRRNIENDKMENNSVTLEQIVLAASTYNGLFNDSEESAAEAIPGDYIVPDSEPWPESVRGLPLGRQLGELQRNCPPQLREKLEDLRILPNTSKTTSKERSVVVPSPTPLEEEELMSVFAATESEDEQNEKLSANDIRFQNVFTALKTYKKMYGDLLVPQPFAVPSKSSDWPEEIWGLRLGARVNAIRSQGTFITSNPERRLMLDELGFVWSPPKEQRGRRGRKAQSDQVDSDDDAESDDVGDEGPKDGTAIDSQNTADDYLFDGSFDFGQDFGSPAETLSSSTFPSWDLKGARVPDIVAKAAEQEAYMKEDEYQEPRTLAETLEEATQRALDVGVIEGLTATKRVIKGKREKDIPWFNDDFGEYFVFEDVVEALTTYKSIYGDFSNLTEDFVVPGPKEITGFRDDDFFDVTNNMDKYGRKEPPRLRQTDSNDDFDPGQGRSAITEYYSQDDEQWGEHLAGMLLGNLVSRIRDGSLEVKHIKKRKALFDKIGFDWGDEKYFIDIPFEKAMCAMYAYYLIRGDMFVYLDFVMPDEDPWPQALAGYELGEVVKRIRELQNFLEAYHSDKVSLLRMIDFVWFSDTVALPLDPNEREMTSETLLLSAMGHPDYAKMNDIPMGLPDKIMADGPFYETNDDPKLWWRKWHNWDYVKDYWYQQGRRDNAYVLKRMGYPQMAEEHEAKYGMGMFKQIDETMSMLELGFGRLSQEEKQEVLQRLDFFRQELIGCTDVLPRERDEFISAIDTQIALIMKDATADMMAQDEIETAKFEFESVNGKEHDSSIDDSQDKDDVMIGEELYEEDEDEQAVDLEDELGFGER